MPSFSGSALGLQAMLLGILLVGAAAWVALIKLNSATITGSNDASLRRRVWTVVLVGAGTFPALAIGVVSATLQFLIP